MSRLRASLAIASIAFLSYAASPGAFRRQADPIASLIQEIEAGKSNLSYSEKHGYLEAILAKLDIQASSQILVWSKTSLQGPRISPIAPRAIYFNDHAYVGWVNGGELIEIAAIDPVEGTKMYTIRNEKQVAPKFFPELTRCIACHTGPGLGSTPRLLARSVNADRKGYQILRGDARVVTPRTPIAERWGGWYVSGTHGKMRHRGNAPAVGDDEGFTFDPELGANKTDLSRYFDVKDYLSPHSDIAALMVFEHQMYVQNAITRTSRGLRVLSESVESATEPLVDALLGYGEVTLSEPVIGSDVFRRDYEKSGARSGSRFNLRELDLTKRVYKYPISPMIESDSYKALPTAAKEYVRKRFGEIASAPGEKYSYLTESDFALLRDYLRSTSSGQP